MVKLGAVVRSHIVFTFIVYLAATCAAQQSNVPQPQPPAEPHPAYINFFVPVDTTSVNQLINIVDNQQRMGTKKITILISSIGGDPAAAFTAYNYLRGLHIEVTTFNMGNVDSAAVLLYCSGSKRYALKGTEFLLHGVSMAIPSNAAINAQGLENNLAIVRNQNHMISRVLSANTKKSESDLDNLISGQTILTVDEAVKWGLVNSVKEEYLEPGAVLVTLNAPTEPPPAVAPASKKLSTLPNIPTVPDWRGTGSADMPKLN